MTIIELMDKFKNAPIDITLTKDLELNLIVTFVPEDPLAKYTILEDKTGKLEAVPSKRKIFEVLKSEAGKGNTLRFKGRLDKTEFGNIAFVIEDIIE